MYLCCVSKYPFFDCAISIPKKYVSGPSFFTSKCVVKRSPKFMACLSLFSMIIISLTYTTKMGILLLESVEGTVHDLHYIFLS